MNAPGPKPAKATLTSDCTLPITDTASLNGALKDANIPTLLMVYTTYSRNRAYLDRFAPYLRGIYTAEGPSDVPEDIADDLVKNCSLC